MTKSLIWHHWLSQKTNKIFCRSVALYTGWTWTLRSVGRYFQVEFFSCLGLYHLQKPKFLWPLTSIITSVSNLPPITFKRKQVRPTLSREGWLQWDTCDHKSCVELRGKLTWINCDQCERWYHITCVGLRKKTIKKVDIILWTLSVVHCNKSLFMWTALQTAN